MQTLFSLFFVLAVSMNGGPSAFLPGPAQSSPPQITHRQQDGWGRGDVGDDSSGVKGAMVMNSTGGAN